MAYKYIRADNLLAIRSLMNELTTYLTELAVEADENKPIYSEIASALYTVANMISIARDPDTYQEHVMEHISESLALAELLLDDVDVKALTSDMSDKSKATKSIQDYAGKNLLVN